MYQADKDYSREAAAYEAIPPSFQGTAGPKYFGSWTFNVEYGPSLAASRPVRMILLEFVPGETIIDILLGIGAWPNSDGAIDHFEVEYELLPPEAERLDVLATAMEIQTKLHHAGIVHRDINLWSVLVSRSGRVVIIDFPRAVVYKRVEWGRKYLERKKQCPKPPSPALEWCDKGLFFAFGSWVPKGWLRAQEKEWVRSRWMGSDRFMPLPEDFIRNLQDYEEKQTEAKKPTSLEPDVVSD